LRLFSYPLKATKSLFLLFLFRLLGLSSPSCVAVKVCRKNVRSLCTGPPLLKLLFPFFSTVPRQGDLQCVDIILKTMPPFLFLPPPPLSTSLFHARLILPLLTPLAKNFCDILPSFSFSLRTTGNYDVRLPVHCPMPPPNLVGLPFLTRRTPSSFSNDYSPVQLLGDAPPFLPSPRQQT